MESALKAPFVGSLARLPRPVPGFAPVWKMDGIRLGSRSRSSGSAGGFVLVGNETLDFASTLSCNLVSDVYAISEALGDGVRFLCVCGRRRLIHAVVRGFSLGRESKDIGVVDAFRLEQCGSCGCRSALPGSTAQSYQPSDDGDANTDSLGHPNRP